MRVLRTLCAALALVGLSDAASGQIVLHPGSFSAGGGASEGVSFEVVYNVGDALATGAMTGGGFELSGGVVAVASTAAVPAVQHQEPGVVNGDEPVQIVASVAGPVHGVVLHYRRGGDSAFQQVSMTGEDGTFSAVIPDSVIGSRGISYFITVEDELGRTFRTPALGSFSIRVQLGGEGLVRQTAQPAGTDQAAYRLVSVPIRVSDPRPEAVLSDDLGPYDPMTWRFFGLDFDQRYQEFPDLDSLVTGRGYWLITSEPDRVIDTGAGVSTPTDQPFEILLHPRWNLVGTPFDFPVSVSQLALASGQPFALRSLENGWNDPVRDPVRAIEPFEGYAVFNDLQRVDTLLVYPHPTSAGKSVTASALAKTEAASWAVHVSAETRDGRDGDNVLGVREGALPGYDAMDLPEPPRYADFVSVNMPRPEWNVSSERFSTDFRSAEDTSYVWTLAVTGPAAEVVQLRFDETETVPSHLQAWLVDEMLGVAVDLRQDARYQLVTAPGAERSLRVVIGSDAFVAAHRPEPVDLPRKATVTDVFPSPFASAASIRYVVPEERAVRITVFNVVGAEVARLADGDAKAAGAHLAVWDGRMRDGTPAPSGVYFVQLSAGGETHVASVVLVR